MITNIKDAGIYDEKRVIDTIDKSLRDIYNVESGDRKLEFIGLEVAESKYDPNDWRDLKKALIERDTIGRDVRGEFVLRDNTGKVIDRKKMKIGELPSLTKTNTYMVDGINYITPLQLRLKPGGYARFNENDEPEVFNSATKMAPIRTILTPESQEIKLKIRQGHVPLYPILKALDVPDDKIKKTLGDGIYRSNYKESIDNDIKKAYKSLFKKTTEDTDEAKAAIKDYFTTRGTDPDINEQVLGGRFDKLDGDYWLSTARKVVDLSRGDTQPVNRDSLQFKSMHNIEDVIKYNIDGLRYSKDMYRTKNVMKNQDDIRKILNPQTIGKQLKKAYTSSSLSRFASQANPIDMITGAMTTTMMGEGGITNVDAIPMSARLLQDSYAGFIDATHTPECHDDKTMVFTKAGWKLFKDTTMNDEFACNIDGRMEFHKPNRLIAEKYKGTMYGAKSVTMDYLVTPNHRMWVKPDNSKGEDYYPEYRFEAAEKTHTKPRVHAAAHDPYIGEQVKTFSIPMLEPLQKIKNLINLDNKESYDAVTWASFMGWYLSEGCCVFSPKRQQYVTCITQRRDANPHKCDIIESVIEKLGYHFRYSKGKDYSISSKQLTSYLHQFGKSNEKWIPEEFFNANIEVRQALLDALILGDGKLGNKRKSKPNWNVNGEYRVYFTASEKLADGFERLAISLGYPTSRKIRPDHRKESYFDIHEISLLLFRRRTTRKQHYYTVDYDGMVYCAEVPGGLLYTKRDACPIWSGNSQSAGVTLYLADNTRRKGDTLETKVIDVLTGKEKWITPKEALKKGLAFPGEFIKDGKNYKPKKSSVHIIKGDDHIQEKADKVQYMIASASGMFDISSNTVPFLHSNQGNRALTAAKMATQGVGLVNREAPLVETIVDGKPITEAIGKDYSIRSDYDGTVDKITKEYIEITDNSGKKRKVSLFNNMPLQGGGLLEDDLKVNVGDKVKKGHLLADSNFTKDGKLAYGVNLTTAYLPYRGYNFEDGIVISENAAKKLSSKHLNRVSLPVSRDTKLNLNLFRAHKPHSISEEDVGRYSDDGVIKAGTKVHSGDILATALRKNQITGVDMLLAKLKKSAIGDFKDHSLTWDRDYEGEVVDVVKKPDRIDVYLKTEEPLQVGDKVTSRHANKGIIGKIIPDNECPITASGEKVDIILDPHGVAPRINVGQILENAAGKLAHKTGKQYQVENFSGKDYYSDILAQMKKAGIKEKENIYDPSTGKTIPDVSVGKLYTTKLKHQVDKKMSARGISEPYSIAGEPTRGGGIGGQSLDRLTFNAMLGYNARDLLREMLSVKSGKNDAYWHAIQHGEIPPAPQPSKELEKFESLMKTMGINTIDKGTSVKLAPLLDRDIDAMSSGEITSPTKMFIGKGDSLTSDKDGLFGEVAEGLLGNKFTHLDLGTKIAKPAYKDAIKSVLNITDAEYEELLRQ